MSFAFPALKTFLVRSLSPDYLRVAWQFDTDQQSVFDLEMQVQRSESAEGPWTVVSGKFRDRYSFIDTSIPVGNKFRQLHYRLEARHIPTDSVKVYGPVTQEAMPDLIALELQRHFMLLYKEFSGRPCWLFPVRTFGPRCPSCWDKRTQTKTRSRCVTCFGTSYMHGYLSPILVYVDISPNANGQQVSSTGKQQQQNTTGELGWYPKVKPDDVLVEPENIRWRVISQAQTEQGRAPVSQQLQLHQLEAKDIEMELPLDASLVEQDLWLGPRRNFNNPHNLNNDRETLSRVYPRAMRGVKL